MREWWRETIMRRRGKRGPNDSESTGKIGQELPQGQLAPLRPRYPDEAPAGKGEPVLAEPEGQMADASAQGELKANAGGSPHAVEGGLGEGEELSLPFEEAGEADEDSDEGEQDASELEAGPKSRSGSAAVPVYDEPGGRLEHETQPESPSVPPPAAQASSPRAPRGFVVLTIGLPGSGKTTWFKRRAVQPLSSDMLRSILFDDITEQRYQGLVFSTLRSLLRARLIAKMPWNYVDATNLSPHERRQWIKMAKSFGYDVHAVFFDVPFAVCMERNRRRERVVSEDVMQKMAERLRPPSFKEGFSKITVVRVKGAGPSTSVLPAGEDEGEMHAPEAAE